MRRQEYLASYVLVSVGLEIVVSIATRYGLEGLVVKSQWQRDFPHLSSLALGPNSASCTKGTGYLSHGVKWPGSGVDHPTASSAKE